MTRKDAIKLVNERLRSNGRWKPFTDEYVKKVCPELTNYLAQIYPAIDNVKERLYLLYNQLNEPPKCPICGNKCRFKGLSFGYSPACEKHIRTVAVKKSWERINEEAKRRRTSGLRNHNAKCKPNAKLQELACVKLKAMVSHFEKTGRWEWPASSAEARKKAQQTELKRYGSRSIHKISSKEFWLERYGVDNPTKLDSVRKKLSTNNAMNNREYVEKVRIARLRKHYRVLVNSRPKLLSSFDVYCSGKELLWQCECGTIFTTHRFIKPKCPQCYPSKRSDVENKIVSFLREQNFVFKMNDRSILNPYEVDFWLPGYNLAIEIHGLYWHSELNVDKNYHKLKADLAEEKGVRLLQFFSDEISHKWNVVQSIILHKLGKTTRKIHARKCCIRRVKQKEARQFLLENHLAGFVNCRFTGLYHNNELVFLLGYSKARFSKNYDFELVRICSKTNTIVVGGLSKLLNYLKRQHPNSTFACFVDRRFGQRHTYEKLGFKLVKITNPGYFWVDVNERRYNRQHLQKHKLLEMFDDVDEIMSESEILRRKGWARIYDAGHFLFVL